MTLLEAIQNCGENWFRPTSMRGEAEALSINGLGMLIIHQATLSGFKAWPHSLNHLEEITGEWEIVTPEQVMKERK